MKITQELVGVFETYLKEKGTGINDHDKKELEQKINNTLSGKACTIYTNMGSSAGIIEMDNDTISITSEQLDNYLEEYSME